MVLGRLCRSLQHPPQGWIDTKFKSMPPFLMCMRTPRSLLGHCPSSTQGGCMSQGGSSFGLRSNHVKDPQSNHRSITKTPLRPQPIHNPLCQYPLLINLQLNFHHPTCGKHSGFPTASAACWSIPGIWDPKRSPSLPEVFPSFFCFFLAPLYPLPGYWEGVSPSPPVPSLGDGTEGDAGMPPSYFQRVEWGFVGCLVWVFLVWFGFLVVLFFLHLMTPPAHLRTAEDLSRPEQS